MSTRPMPAARPEPGTIPALLLNLPAGAFGSTACWHNHAASNTTMRILTHDDIAVLDGEAINATVEALFNRRDRLAAASGIDAMPPTDPWRRRRGPEAAQAIALSEMIDTLIRHATPDSVLWNALTPATQTRLIMETALG